MNRDNLTFVARISVVILIGGLTALAIAACSQSSLTSTEILEPTPTFSPVDATATWVAFKPERDRMTLEILEQKSLQATVIASTQIAMEATVTLEATVQSPSEIGPQTTQAVLPERTIATGPINRIAYSDGKGSLFTVNPDGTERTTIGDGGSLNGEFRYTFPVWSRDGGSLSFSSYLIFEETVSQSSLHRADADGKGMIVTLAVDPTSQSGIGPGVPHFTTWSPNGDRIALTTSGEFGIGSMILGSYAGEVPKSIAIGAPLYINWAPDGSAILIHQDAGLHIMTVDGNTSGSPRSIGTGSISFNSPTWSPDSQQFAHVESINGKNSVVITNMDEIATTVIVAEGDNRVGLGWSPDGKKIAIARSSRTSFHTLSIYNVNSGQERILHEGNIRSFWWSPDGNKLAIIEDSPAIDFAHKWSIVDVESGDLTPLVTQVTSDEFLFVQVFFDQYADSHNLWSPDSSKIVISGTVLDLDKVVSSIGDINLPQEFDSQVWVLDANGLEDPVSVGKGTIASWSPQ